jgi:hypothetical protein
VSPFFLEDLRFQLEDSPFSEEITLRWAGEGSGDGPALAALDGTEISAIDGAGEGGLALRGIFDESPERDAGTKAARVKPRVLVFRWPVPSPAGLRVTVRGKEYAVTSQERDANLGIVAWLR